MAAGGQDTPGGGAWQEAVLLQTIGASFAAYAVLSAEEKIGPPVGIEDGRRAR